MKQFLRGYVERDIAEPIGGELGDPIWFIATTEGRKADGLDLQMDRLRLERFQTNPVIGYGHSYWGRESLPIGQAIDYEVAAPALRLQVQFDPEDDFAVKVERKVRAGFLRAMSVGFDAWDVDQEGVPAAWELFESSIVPIPMDPDAVAEVSRAAVRDYESAVTAMRQAIGRDDDETDPGPAVDADEQAKRIAARADRARRVRELELVRF